MRTAMEARRARTARTCCARVDEAMKQNKQAWRPETHSQLDFPVPPHIGVGGDGQGDMCPLKFGKTYFSGNYYIKLGHFLGQKSCKIREFCKFFGQIS